jgi:8-oxo-dGTP pyrophosphatase MutT (NUDIX family)
VVPPTKLKKAGSFVYTSKKQKILLVQSRGQMWGPPKGSIQPNEEPLECAIREVKEETGLDIIESQFIGSIIIKSKALYYFIDTEDEWDVFPQRHIKDNDANGIGWFNVECLDWWISQGIVLNQHCRILVKKIFEKDVIHI